MKIVAFLQNQWWKDPEGVKRVIEESDDPEKRRRRFIRYGLSICATGKRLEKCLLPEIGCETFKEIYWENSSREIGGKSSSKFPADPKHMQAVYDSESPDVILCFGKVAKDGLDKISVHVHCKLLYAVHPASRGSLETMEQMAQDLKNLIKEDL